MRLYPVAVIRKSFAEKLKFHVFFVYESIYKIYLFIYLFGCTGSLLCHTGSVAPLLQGMRDLSFLTGDWTYVSCTAQGGLLTTGSLEKSRKKFLINTKQDAEIEEMAQKESTRHVQRCKVVGLEQIIHVKWTEWIKTWKSKLGSNCRYSSTPGSQKQ